MNNFPVIILVTLVAVFVFAIWRSAVGTQSNARHNRRDNSDGGGDASASWSFGDSGSSDGRSGDSSKGDSSKGDSGWGDSGWGDSGGGDGGGGGGDGGGGGGGD